MCDNNKFEDRFDLVVDDINTLRSKNINEKSNHNKNYISCSSSKSSNHSSSSSSSSHKKKTKRSNKKGNIGSNNKSSSTRDRG